MPHSPRFSISSALERPGIFGVLTLGQPEFLPPRKVSEPGRHHSRQLDRGLPVDAQFISFGSIRVDGGRFSAEARLWDLKEPAESLK